MKFKEVEKTVTVYTIQVTQEELQYLAACVGRTNPYKVAENYDLPHEGSFSSVDMFDRMQEMLGDGAIQRKPDAPCRAQ